MPHMPSGVGVMCSFWLDRLVMPVRPRRLTMWRQTQKTAVRYVSDSSVIAITESQTEQKKALSN